MEVPVVLMCTVVLLSSFPVILGENDLKENNKATDMAIDESNIMVSNTFHLLPMDETSEMFDSPQFQDNPMERPPPNNRYSLQSDYTQTMENKIESFVHCIKVISNKMKTLEDKVNRILQAVDPINKRSPPKNDCDLMDSFEIMNKLNSIHQHIISSTLEGNQIQVIRDFVASIGNEKRKHTEQSVLNRVLENSEESVKHLAIVSHAVKEIDDRTLRMSDKLCRQSQEISHNNRNTGYYPNHKCDSSSCHQNRCQCDATKRQDNDGNESTYRNVKRDLNRVSFEPKMHNCHDLKQRKNGIYKFSSLDEMSNEAGRFYYERYCDFDTHGVAWTVIQRRFMNDQPENFNRTWLDYKLGFGQLDKEFWLGNDFIHKLTSDEDVELRIVLEDTSGRKKWAEYSTFKVDSEDYNYNLIIGGYRGIIPDCFLYNSDQEFSTYDRQNGSDDNLSCASSYGNGWWYNNFNNCTEMPTTDYKGIIWENWLGSNLLRSSKMMVRPKGLWDGERSNDDEYIFTSTALDP